MVAAIVSLPEFQRAKLDSGLRSKLHQGFDEWSDKVEEELKEPKPTLEQITAEIFQRRQELTAAVAEALIESRYQQEQERDSDVCPGCGVRLRARQTPPRTVETRVGKLKLARPYFYCLKCQQGFYPLDESLALSHRRKQADLQEAIVRLTKEVPYETACERLQELTGLKVGTPAAHEMTEEIARGLDVLAVSPSRAESLTQIAAASAPLSTLKTTSIGSIMGWHARAGTRLGAAALNQPISLFVRFASSGLALGGIFQRETRCWLCAVLNTMGLLIGFVIVFVSEIKD